MTKEERFDILGKYLRGELTGLEQKSLEAQLETDPSLRKELEFHRGLHQAVGDKRFDYFQELVRESEQRYFEKASNRKTGLKLYQKIAAAALLLVIATIGYFYLSPSPPPEELFATYFEPYQSPGTFRSEDLTTLDQDFILGLARYDEERYHEAAQYFTKTLEKDPEKDIAIFLRGVSRLAIDQTALAEQDLLTVIADEQSLFVEQAKWYLSLLYLKREESDRARGILEGMKKSEKIQQLLKMI